MCMCMHAHVCACTYFKGKVRKFFKKKNGLQCHILRNQARSEVTMSIDKGELLTLTNYKDQMWHFSLPLVRISKWDISSKNIISDLRGEANEV